MEATDSGKHSSLLRYDNNYYRKVFNIEIMPFTITIKVILIRPLKMYKVMILVTINLMEFKPLIISVSKRKVNLVKCENFYEKTSKQTFKVVICALT